MKKIITLLGICSLIALFSCTKISGVDVTEYFDVSSYYTKLEVSDGMIVTVTDEVDDIVITADEGVMQKIVVRFTGSTLQIHRTDISLVYLTHAEVLLPYNGDLRDIQIGYDSEFQTPYTIEGSNVKVKVDERSKFSGYILADNLNMNVLNNSSVNSVFDVSEKFSLKIENSSKAELDGYAPTVNLVMNDHSTLERQWNGSHYAFMCDYCYGTMYGNCTAYIDCDSEIAMDVANYSILYYTSDPYLGESTVDDTSDFVYSGGY